MIHEADVLVLLGEEANSLDRTSTAAFKTRDYRW